MDFRAFINQVIECNRKNKENCLLNVLFINSNWSIFFENKVYNFGRNICKGTVLLFVKGKYFIRFIFFQRNIKLLQDLKIN